MYFRYTFRHIMPGLRSDCESIEYSAYRSGSDMSEVFGIREYREGDSIRNIHWKLTGKCDDIMIKLPSLPVGKFGDADARNRARRGRSAYSVCI